ncbi:MAG TPA: hypothetical protein PK280_02490 [Planctomycetota bacterium]|nr:hypothetical protein [Planctomycetota bacterium]
MTRILSSLLLMVALALTGRALAEEYEDHPRLFQVEADEARPEFGIRLWLTSGDTKVVSGAVVNDFDHGRNIMALLEGEVPLPDHSWVSVWGRLGTSISDSGGETDGGEDCEASFGLFELNLGLCLAGRSSPLAPEHALPQSYTQVYAGLRVFQESFDYDLAGGNSATYDARWYGPQFGLRGFWHLGDSYPDGGVDGWGLSAGAAVMPWLLLDADADGTAQDSCKAFGYTWSVAASYQSDALIFRLGYEAQWLKTDGGAQEGSGDLYLLESSRHGPFFSVGISF